MAACAACKAPIHKFRDHHCPTCDVDYCANCCKGGSWNSVAAGIDYPYLDVTCPKGHQWRQESTA